jgi:hypothetical protein
LLHVFDENYETIEEPEGIVPEQEEYTIEVGEVIQLVTPFTPNKPINPENWIDVSKEVSDDTIIDVGYGYYYTVKGLKEGTATVTLEIYSSYSDRHYGEKTITINVVEKKEQQDDPKEEDPEETDPPQQPQEDKKDSVTPSDKTTRNNTEKSQKNNSNKSYTGIEKKTSEVTNTSTNEEKKSEDHDAEITDNQSVETEPVTTSEEKVDTEEKQENADTEIIDNSTEEKDVQTKEEVKNRNWYIWTVPVLVAFILIFFLKRRKKED